MEGGATLEVLPSSLKEPAAAASPQDDADAVRKEVIPNGMNGGYESKNGDTDDNHSLHPDQEEEEEEDEEVIDDDDEGMEVDSVPEEDIEPPALTAAKKASNHQSISAAAAAAAAVLENRNIPGGLEISVVSTRDTAMEVDNSRSSDVECLDESGGSESGALKICEENGQAGSSDVEEIVDGDDEPVALDNNSDIEEIKPEDPLAEVDSKDKENSKHKHSPMKNISTSNNKTTIVVNDTKRLVEIAAGSKNMKGGKKEPTLVIIDTNSILSGKGGVPVSSSKSSSSSSSNLPHASSAFSVMPIGVPQQMYANTRTTITPVPLKTTQSLGSKGTTITPVMPPQPSPQHHHHQQQLQQQQQQQQQMQASQILPTLTDDMYVVEAPSFIVPYVYEKPPLKPLKEFVTKLDKNIKTFEKDEKVRKQARKEKKLTGEASTNDDEEDDSDDDEKKDDDTLDLTADKTSEEKSEAQLHEDRNKIPTYFDLPLGKFFTSIGVSLVQEYVQTDLLRQQKRKHSKGGTSSAETQMAINSLIKNLEFSKENNEPFHFELKKCEFCNFKTESLLAMQHHLETPHMRNYMYKCNFCPVEVRSPHDILYHMEAEHNTRGRLERGPAFHQCPNCPFEDNQKGKLTRHILACQKKFRPERNLEPSMDWEPPAKIPRLHHRPRNMPQPSAAALAMAMGAKGPQQLLPKLLPAPVTGRGRGRPPMQPRYPDMKPMGRPGGSPGMRQDNMSSMMYRPTSSGLGMVPQQYNFGGSNQLFQVVGGSGTVISALSGVSSSSSGSSGRPIALVPNVNESQSRLLSSQNTSVTNAVKNPTAKLLSQPSISITPLPRTAPQTSVPGSNSQSKAGGKSQFVICEICDGYIKDLEQLRNHMQWIHKVKIHPKMIYNRPPLNCQKCQFRFFTDQGLERHLLGSHGLVTSSMQEAANKGKDAGRCPACGRVYQWKLLNHVARDHGMTLKPAHLSYKCTVCTATFGMYKQFENHVYSAHSVVAKRVMDNKKGGSSSGSGGGGRPPSPRSSDSLLKPLKINDEITIIPQPAKPTSRSSQPQNRGK
ncbi:uncharacterized protein LOC131669770 isoform X2 [Phymastichus coffea]|uniref:uncharacterized protein LOC131669770 isoform X2 n=1 Tax=Phymastichus coffea TaxID=108790 RepID=UPI00273C923C|nr:uncharacterized protein LOC131669770 isoform X2 [Phymastichus coffea]